MHSHWYIDTHVHTHTHTHTQLMMMLANHINSLESDKQKLKAQVKRLCSENNWLRKELTDHQQLLQETEIALTKTKEGKEHVEFMLDQVKKESRVREQSPSMDVDIQEESAEGVCVCVCVCDCICQC